MRIEYIVLVGLTVNIFGSIPYVLDTLKGVTKPNRVSYFLWFVIPLIGILASWSEGVTWALVPVISASLIPLIIFVSSFFNRQAYWQLRRFDYACGLLSILAIVVWQLTDSPEAAILLAIVADILAGLPTLVKIWKYPETETPITYLFGLLSALTGLFVLQEWTIVEAAFPIFIIVGTAAFSFAAYRKKIFAMFG